MNLQEIKQMDETYYMNTFGQRRNVAFDHGKGITLYDTEGNAYTDFFAGIAVNALGYAHPAFVKALQEQAGKLLHTSSLYYIEQQARLAKMIVERSCADRVFLANSGAEANEGAIKLAKIYFHKQGKPERSEIITLTDSFHGRTLTTVAATGQPKYQKPYRPLTPGFIHVPLGDFAALAAAVTDKTAAILLEPIQGESGVHPCGKEYLQKVRALCDEKGIVLIFDEVQTGIGRTGKLFAYEHYGVEPDIFTLAKALGGGVPIGAVCAKEVFCAFEPGDHGSTFGGNPFSSAAGCAVLDIIEREGLVEHAAEVGAYLKEKLCALAKNYPDKIAEVRGVGLMLGVEYKDGLVKAVNDALFARRILCGNTATTLRILPPLIVTKDEIDAFIEVLDDVTNRITK